MTHLGTTSSYIRLDLYLSAVTYMGSEPTSFPYLTAKLAASIHIPAYGQVYGIIPRTKYGKRAYPLCPEDNIRVHRDIQSASVAGGVTE